MFIVYALLTLFILAIPFVGWSVHLSMYKDYNPKAGYASFEFVRRQFNENLHRLLAWESMPGSLWAEPTIDEAVNRLESGKPINCDEGFEWHASLIRINGKYYWTDPITFCYFHSWASKNWRNFIVREDGVTWENIIGVAHREYERRQVV
jgi:hypothetical protein